MSTTDEKKGHISYVKNGTSDQYDYYRTVLPVDGTLKIYVEGTNTSAEKIIQSIQEVYNGGAFMTPCVALQVMQYFSTADVPKTEYHLTKKEKEVLTLLSEGKSYKMVADSLSISYFTVNSHIKKIYEKLHVHSLGEAVSLALKHNIV